MKRLYLIRHGESESNAGERTEAPHSTGITTRGHQQARVLAEGWDQGAPQLIVTSPFVRTKHTAAPFIKRYNYARKEEWPVQEFTQLCPSEWRGTTHAERMPKVESYWKKADPRYCDGPGAESFLELFERVGDMLRKAAQVEEENIVIFTHGTFTQAAMWHVLVDGKRPSTSDAMERFFKFSQLVSIDNTAVVPFRHESGWSVGGVRSPG